MLYLIFENQKAKPLEMIQDQRAYQQRDNHNRFAIEEIGVINITVKRAAEKTANGYFVIFINLLV